MIAQGRRPDLRFRRIRRYRDWARRIARAEARTFLSAFDDYDVMAANGGTVAIEAILEDAPGARPFILPVGGGD